MSTNRTRAELLTAIELHLNRHSQGGGGHSHTVEATEGARPDATTVGQALYNLLFHYVDQLESGERGPWSLEEETSVRETVAILEGLGYSFNASHRHSS